MVQSTPYQVERLDWEGRKAYVHAHARRLLHRRDRLHQAQGARALRRRHRRRRHAATTARCTWCGASPATRRSATTPTRTSATGRSTCPTRRLHTTALWWQLPQATLRCALRLAAGRARRLPRRGLCAARRGDGGGDGRCARPAEGGRQRRRRVVRHRRRPRARAVARRRWQRGRCRTCTTASCRRCTSTTTIPAASARASRCGAGSTNWCVRARELVERCDCKAGCPACVGPVLDNAGSRRSTRRERLALRVLGALEAA